MRFVIEIDPPTYEQIRTLIERGSYRDLQEFVTTAFVNQFRIEGHEPGSAFPSEETQGIHESTVREGVRTPLLGPFPKGLLRENIAWDNVKTASSPPVEGPFSGYVWGQYNKLLPLKVALRQLALISGRSGPWVELGTVQRTAAETAAHIGAYLRQFERRTDRKQLERLSTGFPKSLSEVKSRERFESQFVGHVTKENVIYGMPGNLGFANIEDREGETVIGITDPGKEFCVLTNPVLDLEEFESPLSTQEAEFYLDHVRQRLPKEWRAMVLMLLSISEGRDSPDDMTGQLRALDEEWSEAVLNTMRVGLLSRMWDLGLIDRSREGQRVRYSLTHRATELLEREETSKPEVDA